MKKIKKTFDALVALVVLVLVLGLIAQDYVGVRSIRFGDTPQAIWSQAGGRGEYDDWLGMFKFLNGFYSWGDPNLYVGDRVLVPRSRSSSD